MRILITCALPIEFNEARNQLGLKESTSKKDIPRIAESKNIILIYTGIGKINSIISLNSFLKKNNVDLVIDSGTCGSLVSSLSPEDIVASTKSIDFYTPESRGSSIKNSEPESIKNILKNIVIGDEVVASIESSITQKDDKNTLAEIGASVVTWETSAIFSLCLELNIPFVSIRGVTDSCNSDTFREFKENKLVVCKKIYNYLKILCKGI